MSNHGGRYMLNHVLNILDKESIFEHLGRERTQNLALKILDLSFDYDCSPGEILEGIGDRVSVCYMCRNRSDEFIDNVCKKMLSLARLCYAANRYRRVSGFSRRQMTASMK